MAKPSARAARAVAADYIVKPFSSTELATRIRAAPRRHAAPEPFVPGELAIDCDWRRIGAQYVTFQCGRVSSEHRGRMRTFPTMFAPRGDQHSGSRSLLSRTSAFHATMMRHRRRYVGSFALADREGSKAFSTGNEEVLVLSAAQAAAAAAGARGYRVKPRSGDLVIIGTSAFSEGRR